MNDTKHNIIVQALKFFSENDYDRASLNSIAEALNVTKGAIYHYFKSKDGLFEEVITFTSRSIDNFVIQRFPENPTVKDLIYGCLHFTNLSSAMQELWGIEMSLDYVTFVNLMYSGVKKFPDVKSNFEESYTSLTSLIESSIEKEKNEGLIKLEVDSRLIALEVVTLAEGSVLMHDFFSSDDQVKMKNFAKDIWNRIKKS